VVAVRDYLHDYETIEWAMTHATAGVDMIHLVHAYRPLRLIGCHWEPVARAREARYWAARRVIAIAQQRIAVSAATQLQGSAIAGTPTDVLLEMSEVADLIVVGDDSNDAETSRRITWRVQDLSQCPVVCVPITYRTTDDGTRPVTVLADEHGLSEAAMSFGVEAALRWGTSLQISRAQTYPDGSSASSTKRLGDQQRELDAQLALWAGRYPLLPLTGRVEVDDAWLDGLRGNCAVLVAPVHSAPLLRPRPLDLSHPCPIAVVPE